MLIAKKKSNSNLTEMVLTVQGQDYVVSSLKAISGPNKKISQIERTDYLCPDSQLQKLWTEGFNKSSSIEQVFNRVLVGKSYRDFLVKETSE